MLDGARVLLVEDELFVALDLVSEIHAAGGHVVGPYPSVAATLAALRTDDVAAAILDANLSDRDVTPVALLLVARNAAVVIHTGIGLPAELRRIHPDLPVVGKPALPTVLMKTLCDEIDKKRRSRLYRELS
jgi:hypothetical protein